MLGNIFTWILNMSITASIVAAVILCIRPLLHKRFPKIFSYALWSIVLVRLIIPISFTSMFSIFNVLPTPETSAAIPDSQHLGVIRYVPHNIGIMNPPEIHTGSPIINQAVNSVLPSATPQASVNPMQILLFAAGVIWIAGATLLFFTSIFMYLRTVHRLKTAVLYIDSDILSEVRHRLKLKRIVPIYVSSHIPTPIVCGVVRPRIICPLFLAHSSDTAALQYIITHELVHIKRLDYLIKPIWILAVCMHWFNPVIWLSFFLFQKDMELACDEKVLSVSKDDVKSSYATSLIQLASKQNTVLSSGLLAFGESNIKSRIQSIMHYKKPTLWVAAAAVTALAVLGTLLLTNASGVPAKKAALHPEGFQLYLVEPSNTGYSDNQANIRQLSLEPTPLLSPSDIVSYNWDTHCIKIKNNGKISMNLLQRRFVVLADGERIYSGAFWSGMFSVVPPKISIYLDALQEDSDPIILALGSWRPGEKIPSYVENILADTRIKKVLERDSQLYKAYIPEHFAKPDYISIYTQGFQYSFGGYDWQKMDTLLRSLDQRFAGTLEDTKRMVPPAEDTAIWGNETVVSLGYNEPRKFSFRRSGEQTSAACLELVMPITGEYRDVLFCRGDDSLLSSALGKLEILQDTTISKLNRKSESLTPTKAFQEPSKMHLVYYQGEPFAQKLVSFYVLEAADAQRIEKEAALGKVIKDISDKATRTLALTLRYGKDDDRWFHVLDDGETLFYAGKYYHNPILAKSLLTIAREKCGFKIFDTSVFQGITKAKYSFRTNTRTIERSTEDPAVLKEMEKGLQRAQHSMASGCPFSAGVLTLTFADGKVMDISMASDSCAIMFIDENYLEYSQELHKLFTRTFDNFPFVRG